MDNKSIKWLSVSIVISSLLIAIAIVESVHMNRWKSYSNVNGVPYIYNSETGEFYKCPVSNN